MVGKPHPKITLFPVIYARASLPNAGRQRQATDRAPPHELVTDHCIGSCLLLSRHANTSLAIHLAGRMLIRPGKSGRHATVSSTVRGAKPSREPTSSAPMARSSNGTCVPVVAVT